MSHSTGTLSGVASHLLGQRPSYINPSTDGVTCKEDNDCTAPTAPPVSGLSPATAETAQEKKKDPFEELYTAYGVRAEIGAARRAYNDLAPDKELHAAMMTSARAWREAAGESIERMHLRRWITEQRYLEDPKGERKPKERRAKDRPKEQKAKPMPSAVDEPFQIRRHLMRIILADLKDGWLNLVLLDADDGDHDLNICLESANEEAQVRGQRQFQKLLAALSMYECNDSSELQGKSFVRVLRGKFAEYEFEPDPANDNQPAETVVDDWKPAASSRPPMPRFADVIAAHPISDRPWLKLDYDDEEEAA